MWIEPVWTHPAGIGAAMSTRLGGVSLPPFDSLNLGLHVGDVPEHVLANRERLRASIGVRRIAWLNQVHGNVVVDVGAAAEGTSAPEADAAVTRAAGVALAIMVADCLPVLLARRDGTAVAAAHAGWRGLATGVIGNAFRALNAAPDEVTCWLGPAISARRYEVDEVVRAAFPAEMAPCFSATRPGHFQMDLAGVARLQLVGLGVAQVACADACVFERADDYFSHRRAARTGRCAALVWIRPAALDIEG